MPKAKLNANTPCLRQHITDAVSQYLKDMGNTPPDNLYQVLIAEVEKPMIETVLEHTNGNQSRAAELLGLTRGTLRNRIRRYGL